MKISEKMEKAFGTIKTGSICAECLSVSYTLASIVHTTNCPNKRR